MTFKVGDKVRWTSQSQGYVREKRGKVVAAIQAHEHPMETAAQLAETGFNDAWIAYSLPRNHESYLVAVPTKSGRGKPRLYWPLVSLLRKDDEVAR